MRSLGTPTVVAIDDRRADAIWGWIGWDFGSGSGSNIPAIKALNTK